MLIDKSSSKSFHTNTETKLCPRANKFQSKTYHANSPTKQEHNTRHKNTGSQKSHQTHRHPKTHYWTLHCTREKRSSYIHQKTYTVSPNHEILASQNSPTPPTGSRLHNKDEPQTSSLQKGHSKHSNLNKMKGREIISR